MGKREKAGCRLTISSRPRVRRASSPMPLEDYRSLVENCPDIIDRFDRDFHHLYVNAAGAELHGVTVAEIIGKTIRETGVTEPFSSLWEDRIRTVFKTRKALEVRDTFRRTKGLGYYESRCVPEFAGDGTVRSVLVVSRDITALMRAGESMKESESLLRRIIEQSPMSMAIVGMDGTIEYINSKAIETFGYSPKEIPTMKKWWVKAYPDVVYRQKVIDQWMGKVKQAIVENREIEGDEYLVTCKDHSVKTMFIFGVPVANKIFVMFNDVTAYKTLQSELEKIRDQLEAKVRDRTAKLQALAAEVIQAEHRERRRIAHVLHEDLQQWLAAAKFHTGELRAHELSHSALDAADRVQQMLDKAIEVTRTLSMSFRPPVIHEQGPKMALRWLADDMRQKFNLSVAVSVGRVSELVSKEMGLFVFDAVRELLLNVVKHAGVKTVTVRLGPEGHGRFKVEVCDRGRGFNPSVNRVRKFGLFSIRERADVLGGSMALFSKRGEGTRVILRLPLKQR